MVLYTYKPINDRVTHNEILYKVEVRFSSFLLLTDRQVQSIQKLNIY